MIPYEELDRALARWKARSQGGAPVDAIPEAEVSASAPLDVIAEETALPIGPGDLGSVPDPVASSGERTGEIDLSEVESYEDVQK